ncbi:MAG: hypothetical protein EOO06_14785 [Chitinophagaceae bacterium]|nr:MAG: hypothetical protein EOO06_14785 [Chitinophagaceae bacterium]
MKTRRIIYLIIGITLVVLNLLVDIVDYSNITAEILKGDSFSIGYLIGSQFLMITGIAFLGLAARSRRKLNNSALEKSIAEIGSDV